MGEKSNFQQRWDIRRKDYESSSDESESNGEPKNKYPRIASEVIAIDNHQTPDSYKSAQQANVNLSSSSKGRTRKSNKGKGGRRTRTDDDMAQKEEKRKGPKEVRRKKSKTYDYDQTSMDDLESYANSLIDDIKSERENLLDRLKGEARKMVAEEIPVGQERRGANSPQNNLHYTQTILPVTVTTKVVSKASDVSLSCHYR